MVVVPSTIGTSVTDLLRSYEELVGAETVANGLATISPAAQGALEHINPLDWIPNTVVAEIVEAMGRAASMDCETLLDRAVRLAVRRTFRSVWRVLLRFTSDDALISRTPMIWSKSRNTGKLESRRVAPGHGVVLLTGWPEVTDRHARTLGVSLETVLTVAGRRDVRWTWERTRSGASFDIRWRL